METKNKVLLLLFFLILVLSCFSLSNPLKADPADELAGKILLQTEKNGEAWYINPKDGERYYLGSPSRAFDIMKDLGVGISSGDISKILVGVINATSTPDTDGDGLSDDLERALGTSPVKKDTDQDGYNDKKEILEGYNPLNKTKLDIDAGFAEKHAGKIFIETQRNGEAWYVDPEDEKRYFLNRPRNAFNIMKKLGSGVTNEKLNNIPRGDLSEEEPTEESKNNEEENEEQEEGDTCSSCDPRGADTAKEALDQAIQNIREKNTEEAIKFFTEDMEQPVVHTLDFLDKEGRYTLANTLAGSELSSSDSGEERKIYKNTIQFHGEEVPLEFRIKKKDGRWFLANL